MSLATQIGVDVLGDTGASADTQLWFSGTVDPTTLLFDAAAGGGGAAFGNILDVRRAASSAANGVPSAGSMTNVVDNIPWDWFGLTQMDMASWITQLDCVSLDQPEPLGLFPYLARELGVTPTELWPCEPCANCRSPQAAGWDASVTIIGHHGTTTTWLCDTCGQPWEQQDGSDELWLTDPDDQTTVYAPTTLVHHYINHHYCPPDRFLAAIDHGQTLHAQPGL